MEHQKDNKSEYFLIGFILVILALLNAIFFQEIITIILTLSVAVYCFFVAGKYYAHNSK